MRIAAAAGLLMLAAAAPAAALVSYAFTTDEPFAGGALAFTYTAPDFVTATQFVQAAALTGATPSIQRVRFDPGCAGLGGTPCSEIIVFSNNGFYTTATYRYFEAAAFTTPGTYAVKTGTAAQLIVSQTAAVPEPAAWAMLAAGFAAVGGAVRARRRTVAA